MKRIKETVIFLDQQLEKGSDFALLALRLMLAYSFFSPAITKLQNFEDTVSWFASLGIPLPALNALLATGTELSGVLLLTLGLMTRFISLPLIVTMIVAIITVHGANGFAVAQELSEVHYVFLNGQLQFETSYKFTNGFEIPFYYILMLLILVTKGSGKLSLDQLLFKRS